MDSEIKSATSSPDHLCLGVLPYFGQASYMRFSSSSVNGSFCSARFSAASRPRGFLTRRAGLRVIHSLATQYSKNGLRMLMRRAPVCGLIAHDVRNSRTSGGSPLVDHM